MSESKGLTLAELDAETGEELPKRELMACVGVSVATFGTLGLVHQGAFVCAGVHV